MPYLSDSGTPAWTGPDAFTPPAQAKALVDAEADFNYYTTRATTGARDLIAAPQLREGLLCYVEADDTIYKWNGSTWPTLAPTSRVIPSAATNGSVSAAGVVTSSAQSFVRVRDAFPAGFQVFKVTFDVSTSATVALLMVLAADATDAITGYDTDRTSLTTGTPAPAQDLNQAFGFVTAIGLAGRHFGSFLVTDPNVAGPTIWDASATVTANPMTTSAGKSLVGVLHRTSAAYNSFKLYGTSGTVTINRLTIEGVS